MDRLIEKTKEAQAIVAQAELIGTLSADPRVQRGVQVIRTGAAIMLGAEIFLGARKQLNASYDDLVGRTALVARRAALVAEL